MTEWLFDESPDETSGDWPADPDGSTPSARAKVRHSASAVVLYAAMHGLAEVLQPEKSQVVIEQVNDEPLDRLGIDLSFGDLPPIEDKTLGYR